MKLSEIELELSKISTLKKSNNVKVLKIIELLQALRKYISCFSNDTYRHSLEKKIVDKIEMLNNNRKELLITKRRSCQKSIL